MDERNFLLALFHAPGIGSKLFQVICDFLQAKQVGLDEVFQQPRLFNELIQNEKKHSTNHSSLPDSGIHLLTEKKLQQFNQYLRTYDPSIVEKDLLWQQQANQKIIFSSEAEYPELLKQIDSPPPLLYVIGDTTLLKKVQLAMVGSRNPTPSGQETAYHFANFLAQAGMQITSGMALGIDASSHRGCLDAQGNTIAVAGTGLDRVYPAKHKKLAHQIAEQGALVSCFPLGTGPSRGNFPKRNQIISGLSVGTLVVEAALKSGSLITARLAMEQGREVFAIPGSIHNPLSRGCHALIRQGAKLVETAEDIAEEIISLSIASQLDEQQPEPPQIKPAEIIQSEAEKKVTETQPHIQATTSCTDLQLPQEQQDLLSYIDENPISLDQLGQRSQLSIEDISAMILLLELQGHVQQWPGGKISRLS